MRFREVAIDPHCNWPIRQKARYPCNEGVVKTKHWQFSKKTFVPDAIKRLGNIKGYHSVLTVGF